MPIPATQPIKNAVTNAQSLRGKTLLVMAAGTGGHVFPALAVAHALTQQGALVQWLGTPNGMEKGLVGTQFAYHAINMQGIRGNGLARLLALPQRLLQATLSVKSIIKNQDIDAVVGFGGYVTMAGGLAAKWVGVPLIIHEQNAVAGMSNRYLAKLADAVLQAFAGTFTDVAAHKVQTVGNPVRDELCVLPPPDERYQSRDNAPMRLLVVGGSLGAQALNRAIPQALAALQQQGHVWQVIHQCGKNNVEDTQKAYQAVYHNKNRGDAPQNAPDIRPFIADMASVYAWADVIVCRAGALTVSELAAVGLPAVFVPLPHAVDDHQTKNAEWLAQAGGAVLLPQDRLTGAELAKILVQFDRKILAEMANKAHALGNKAATENAANAIMAVLLARESI